ncbi:MAG: TRAM domain-containing protein, partial [Bacilli bacterium]|nr:TRAM domain-containing protein [Bacilli bacterium]
MEKKIEIEIKKLGVNGEGIGYYNKKVVFIPNCLPEEIVRIYNLKTEKNYYTAEVEKIIKKSDKRVKPACKYFNKCQVCSIMPLKYEDQIYAKKDYLKESIKKYAHIDIKFDKVIKDDNP